MQYIFTFNYTGRVSFSLTRARALLDKFTRIAGTKLCHDRAGHRCVATIYIISDTRCARLLPSLSPGKSISVASHSGRSVERWPESCRRKPCTVNLTNGANRSQPPLPCRVSKLPSTSREETNTTGEEKKEREQERKTRVRAHG